MSEHIEYDQPCPGLDDSGNEVTCNQRVSMTTEDAIKTQRYIVKMSYRRKGKPLKEMTPAELLDEYMIVHWATKVTP